MNELRRHRLVFKIVPIIDLFLKLKFNYKYDSLSKIEGPYLLLANHNLELDPAFVGVAAKKHLYFVASEHILRKGIGTWLLMTFFKPIIHQKGRQGMNTIKEMLKTLKEAVRSLRSDVMKQRLSSSRLRRTETRLRNIRKA